MSDLVAWLRAQVDEDEQLARLVVASRHGALFIPAQHLAGAEPVIGVITGRRLLAEVDAKRRRLAAGHGQSRQAHGRVVRRPARLRGGLAAMSILDLIDGAVEAWEMSQDAMRWSPEPGPSSAVPPHEEYQQRIFQRGILIDPSLIFSAEVAADVDDMRQRLRQLLIAFWSGSLTIPLEPPRLPSSDIFVWSPADDTA